MLAGEHWSRLVYVYIHIYRETRIQGVPLIGIEKSKGKGKLADSTDFSKLIVTRCAQKCAQ